MLKSKKILVGEMICTIEKWIDIYKDANIRTGMRLRFDKGVDSEVRRAAFQIKARI